MKTKFYSTGVLTIFLIFFLCFSCTKGVKDDKKVVKIENTLKSVSLLHDSIRIDPSGLLLSLERINSVIDSIGYPDAGYKLWLVKSDSVKDFRFMIEGYWHNQAIYDSIHDHVLYKNAHEAEVKLPVWDGMKKFLYNRFTIVK